MPRQSAEALSIPGIDARVTRLQPRADAPSSLRQIITDLISSVPPQHFRPSDAALIEQYAQAILLARRAYGELEANGPVINDKSSPWVLVLEKAHRSSVQLSARLRLSPQQREDRKTVGRQPQKPSYPEPWKNA
jgi:phage terminase small subunit